MFYSNQLLARKAPLGQIWMAATMHRNINRKKLCKLDIIKICEEILNPSVPMALRLSGILMGGVVIVYERKVKLLYDDVSRLLVEINNAWKVKAVPDPTALPSGKTQARYEAVTLPDNGDVEFENSMSFSVAAEELPRKCFRMELDDLDEGYININPDDDGISEQHHQADAADITLFDDLGSIFQQGDLNKRFERFDIEGDDHIRISFTPIHETRGVPSTLVPSPPPPHHPPAADGTTDHHHTEEQEPGKREKESPVPEDAAQRRRPDKRNEKAKVPRLAMDDGLLVIPAATYQKWLQDPSDIVSKRPRQTKHKPGRCTKLSDLMELPPVALIDGFDKITGQIYYPEPLLRLWGECAKVHPGRDKPSEGGSPMRPRGPSTYSGTEGLYPQDAAFADFESETDSRTMDASVEKLRANLGSMDFQGVGDTLVRDPLATPESPGRSAKSAPSSGSGPSLLPQEPEVRLPSGRSKRRQLSSSNNSLGSLDPVDEDMPFEQNLRGFKLRRVSEKGPAPDFDVINTELLEETAPEQTPNMVISDPTVDKITQTVRTHLKTHFDTPGAPDSESLNLLAAGMNKKRAAQLFYQTCVLATLDIVKVAQSVPYGDISISRGPKM